MFAPFLAGFALGGSLIVAIGAQNAYVIRQAILGKHIFWICLFCSLSDAVLIWCGIYGLGAFLKLVPNLIHIFTYGGAAFLIWYGIHAMRRAMRPQAMTDAAAGSDTLRSALLMCAAFTFLNPHVYLDTVILVGSIGNARAAGEQPAFATGATVASFAWFFGLGYGATFLRPWLAQPRVWRFIDCAIAVIMFGLALKLLVG
jgi:L-lysine exporter family protein LysE/ArgO